MEAALLVDASTGTREAAFEKLPAVTGSVEGIARGAELATGPADCRQAGLMLSTAGVAGATCTIHHIPTSFSKRAEMCCPLIELQSAACEDTQCINHAQLMLEAAGRCHGPA